MTRATNSQIVWLPHLLDWGEAGPRANFLIKCAAARGAWSDGHIQEKSEPLILKRFKKKHLRVRNLTTTFITFLAYWFENKIKIKYKCDIGSEVGPL